MRLVLRPTFRHSYALAIVIVLAMAIPASSQIISGSILSTPLNGSFRGVGLEPVLPTYIYAIEGQECNVYFDNAFHAAPYGLWEWDVACAKGKQYAYRWAYTPVAGDVATGTTTELAWSVAPRFGYFEADAQTATLRISKLTAGTGVSRNVLCIGDSTGDDWLPEFMNLADGDAMGITLVGEHSFTGNDSESGSRTAAHEAQAGWKWNWFATKQVHESAAGDTANQLANWALAGHAAANTDNGTVYYTLVGGGDILLNGGFESAGAGGADVFASWTEYTSNGTIVDETTVVQAGTHACKLTRGTADYDPYLYQNFTTVSAGQVYTLTGYAQSSVAAKARVSVYDNTHSAYIDSIEQVAVGGTNAWGSFSRSFTIPTDCVSIRIMCYAPTTAASIAYYDSLALILDRKVDLYSDSAGTTLVASGHRINDGEIVLTESGGSGLSGTVDVTYTANDTTTSTNTLVSNFFIRDATVGFDFDQYLTDLSTTIAADDWAVIHLGINGVFNLTSDAEVATFLDTLDDDMDIMIGLGDSPADTTMRGAVSGMRIALCVPIPPAASQDAFGDDYSSTQNRWRYRRNLMLLQQWLLTNYDTAAYRAKDVYVLPLHLNIDSRNNMATTSTPLNGRNGTTYAMQSDSLHPASSGTWQIADSVFAFLKYHE